MKSFTAFILCLSIALLNLAQAGPIQKHHAALARIKAAAGGGWSPSDLASLQRWITADNLGGGLVNNDPISTATDATGNGNNLTQTGSARPTFKTSIANGLPGMLFAKASSQSLTGTPLSLSAVTWWIVFQPVTMTTDTEILGAGPGNAYYRYSGDGDGYMGYYRNARITGYVPAPPTAGTIVMIGVSTASTYEIWINGVSAGAQSADFAVAPAFYLGADSGNTKFFDGYIFETGVCDADIGGTDRASLQSYLATKWQ